MSTTVAEFHGLMRCHGSASFLRCLWSDSAGEIADVHIRTETIWLRQHQLADSLTKHSAKPDELIKAVLTGNLLNVDAHPPFRTMLQSKAFLAEWLARNAKHGPDISVFAGVGIAESMFASWGNWA